MGERVGRRRMILITSFLGTCSAVSFTWLLKQSPMLGMAAGFFLLAILGCLGTLVVLYISEIFDTHIRGTYVGLATPASSVSNSVLPLGLVARPEERRVWTAWGSPCQSRWWPKH